MLIVADFLWLSKTRATPTPPKFPPFEFWFLGGFTALIGFIFLRRIFFVIFWGEAFLGFYSEFFASTVGI